PKRGQAVGVVATAAGPLRQRAAPQRLPALPVNKKHLWRGVYLPSLGVPGPDHLVVEPRGGPAAALPGRGRFGFGGAGISRCRLAGVTLLGVARPTPSLRRGWARNTARGAGPGVELPP